jgi:MFS family permease
MSSIEKSADPSVNNSSDVVNETHDGVAPSTAMEAKDAWYYKKFAFLPYYGSPLAQLLIVAFVCFLCPGMFNALNGLGAGGQVTATANNNANIATYSTFAFFGFFGGTICNKIGVKYTLSIGGWGYCIYSASLWTFNHVVHADPDDPTKTLGSVPEHAASSFIIFAGCLLGLCAGLLWTAQGAIMMSYPDEAHKGRYISYFWMIFNCGSVLGSLVSTTLHFLGQF